MDIIADWDSPNSSNGDNSTSGMSGSYEESLNIKRKDIMSSRPSPKAPPRPSADEIIEAVIGEELSEKILKSFSGLNSMKKIALKKQIQLRLYENGIESRFLSTGCRIIDATKKELIEEIEKIDKLDKKAIVEMYKNVAEGQVDGIASSSTSGSSTKSETESEEEPVFELEERHEKVISKFISITDKYLDNLNEKKDTAIDIETGVLDMFLETPIMNK